MNFFRLTFSSFWQKMLAISFGFIFFFRQCVARSETNYFEIAEYNILKSDLNQMNVELYKINSILSNISWKLSTEANYNLSSTITEFGSFEIKWRNKWCFKLKKNFQKLSKISHQFYLEYEDSFNKEFRKFYLLCRGPVYDMEQNRKLIESLGKLQTIYEETRVCVSDACFRGEPDLERIISKSRDPNVLLWAWTEWRNKVGPPSRAVYPVMVAVLNEGARNNGYNEIGECWREELEMENLEDFVEDIYKKLKPLYEALHAVVRYRLHQYYGNDLVSLDKPIPAHLLGNMWAQNWGSLLDIIINIKKDETLTYFLKKKNYSVIDLVEKAEDFFISLGFKPMTKTFWKYSELRSDAKNGSTCHGTAANMFQPNDFRVILCAEVTEEDFSVIHHELGHIEYYMEYENQPAIFQDGVNSAFQEAIGDAVMYGVISPPHLRRLGLFQEVDNISEIDIKLLLHQALVKLPQIPFGIMLEKWRWDVFKGKILPSDYNKSWWAYRERYQGIKPPITRTEEHFDPSAKFHINDNKPYIRYFLSSILQMQIFESICKAATFGEEYKNQTLSLPLHRCDIYGSKIGTKNLRKVMSLGSSISWKEALKFITGEDTYSVRPLLKYYRPLHKWLLKEIETNNIPVGWNSNY